MAKKPPITETAFRELVEQVGSYPEEAYAFVQEGLNYAQQAQVPAGNESDASPRHITGQELCQGLRAFALDRWGLMSRSVLNRWNIHCTMDFGRIVYALIGANLLQKTEDDRLEHFLNVYDFEDAFERSFRVRMPTGTPRA